MEYGISRKSMSSHILLKNFLQFSVGIICFWLLGYSFSTQNVKSKFIGENYFGGDDWLNNPSIGTNFSYLVTLGTFIVFIVNCAISEKTQYGAYVIITISIMLFVWPVVVAWLWGGGWLAVSMTNSMIDLGSATVYEFAGAFGVCGAVITGRRPNKYNLKRAKYNMTSQHVYVLGAFLTILGCFGVPGVIPQTTNSHNGGIGIANLWICGAVSSITSLKLLTVVCYEFDRHYIAIYQGFIAGMVFITSSCGNTTPWEAGLHGLMSGGVFALTFYLFNWLKLDDSMYVGPTFLFPGIFGGILPGFIDHDFGVYWAGWNSGETLLSNVVGTTTIFFWAVFWGIAVFGTLKL